MRHWIKLTITYQDQTQEKANYDDTSKSVVDNLADAWLRGFREIPNVESCTIHQFVTDDDGISYDRRQHPVTLSRHHTPPVVWNNLFAKVEQTKFSPQFLKEMFQHGQARRVPAIELKELPPHSLATTACGVAGCACCVIEIFGGTSKKSATTMDLKEIVLNGALKMRTEANEPLITALQRLEVIRKALDGANAKPVDHPTIFVLHWLHGGCNATTDLNRVYINLDDFTLLRIAVFRGKETSAWGCTGDYSRSSQNTNNWDSFRKNWPKEAEQKAIPVASGSIAIGTHATTAVGQRN
jgi:hypothetical protein